MFPFTKQEKHAMLFVAALSLISTGVTFASKNSRVIRQVVEHNENLGKIDLNKADEGTLTIVPGIGPAIARRIVNYREANGGIRGLEDLSGIKGISSALIEKIRRYAYVGPVS